MTTKALLALVLAIEWVTLTTLLAPRLIALRPKLNRRPQGALVLWFSLLLSAGLASLLGLSITAYLAFDSWLTLNRNPAGTGDWLATVAASFAPWLLLALGGISLALISRTFDPLMESARSIQTILDQAGRPLTLFQDVHVLVISTDQPLAFTRNSAAKPVIVVTTGLLEILTPDELQAVFWHELGHLRLGHLRLKALSGAVLALSPWLLASRALVSEVNWYCELAADRFAAKQVGRNLLLQARQKVQLV